MTDRDAAALERLQVFVREHAPGGCRVLSVGDVCDCPLCDLDRLRAAPVVPEPSGNIAGALREFLDAFGVPAHICGVDGDITEGDAEKILRLAATLKREAPHRRADIKDARIAALEGEVTGLKAAAVRPVPAGVTEAMVAQVHHAIAPLLHNKAIGAPVSTRHHIRNALTAALAAQQEEGK